MKNSPSTNAQWGDYFCMRLHEGSTGLRYLVAYIHTD